MKRRREGQDEADGTKKRRVEYATFQKWQRNLDRELQTMSWLDCVIAKQGAKKVVAKLKCKVCASLTESVDGRTPATNK